ncbi:MAG: transcription termination/antitermination protein NusA, partial [Gammaproteobacteria bacterium]|nr:transcription termination/antitermination protein NusA [Gammaproteobacteria bacterium]
MEVRVEINLKTGEYDTYRQWKVVDDEADIENEDAEICFSDAKKDYPSVKVGDTIEEQMESIEFGRIAAQTAKQVIVQKVRDAERDKILAEFRNRLGTLVMGTVKRVTPEVIFVDLGEHAEGVLPREELISRESFRVNDRVKALLKDIRPERRVGQILLSRTSDEMLGALLRLEVPEVSEEVIEIKAIARDPGSRAKVAVKTNDGRIDPVGACVGMRGSRVQAISNELNGERVDIIAWDNNPAQFVINALAPADIVSIVMDEDTHSMDVAVKEAHLSQAIGKGGQNVRLASRLTGWRLNVIADTAAQEKQNIHAHLIRDKFMRQLNIDENLATLLVEEGFSSIEEVAYVAEEEMLEIFDEATVKHLRENARNALLSMALSGQPAAGDISEEVLALEGV